MMGCQTATNELPQQPTTVFNQTFPTTQSDWTRFVQRLQETLNAVRSAGYTTGVNVVPTQYSVYDGVSLPGLRLTGATDSLDSGRVQFGAASLKLVATASQIVVTLATTGYPCTIQPFWQWIASVYCQTDQSSLSGTLAITTPSGTYTADISGAVLPNQWARLYGDYDLTADASSACTLTLTLNTVVGAQYWLEGWQLEPVQGNTSLPSPYIITAPPRTWAQIVNDGAKPANNADVTGANTALDTAHVNGVTSASISPIAGLMPEEAGANVTETRTSALTASLSNHTQDNLASGAVYAQMLKSATAETVDNPDFEASTTIQPPPGWINGGGVTSGYTGTAYSGAQSLTLTATSTFGLLSSVRQYPCIFGEQYLVSAVIANNSGSGNTSSVFMQFFDKIGTSLSFGGVSNALAPGTGYQVLTQLVPVPANAVTFRLDLILAGASGAQSFFDNIRLARARSIDNEIKDGTIYGRTSQNDLYVSGGVNRVGLRVAGSGHVLGNQLNAPNSLTLNYGTVRSATSLTATSAGAVSVNAFTYYMGAGSVSYNAVSNAVTGLSQGSTYYIYTHDAGGTGGTKTWLATTNAATLLQTYDDIVVAGSVTIPSSGSSGGGGGGGGCVEANMWLRHGLIARASRWWHRIDCFDLFDKRGKRRHRVRGNPVVQPEPCVRIVTEFGGALVCSVHTPFTDRDGCMALAPGMAERWVLTDGGWERVISVQHVGVRDVVRINVSGLSYAAGENPKHRIYSHNPIK